MRRVWVAVMSAGMMVSGGALGHAAQRATAGQPMCRADKRAEHKTHKAEEKAAKNNAKAAREQVSAEKRQDSASRAGERIPSQMAAVQAPPM
jgi:K+-transporting ATPase c subunit